MKDYTQFLGEFVEIIECKPENVLFHLNFTEEGADNTKTIDLGLLIGIIDTYSSMSCSFLLEESKQLTSHVSMNIKLNSFGEMYSNNIYKMKILLIKNVGKYILLEVQILDVNDKLIKHATHLLKIVKAKF